jgi:hypothetical protein
MSDKQVVRVQEPLGFSGYLITLSEQAAPSTNAEPAKVADAPREDAPQPEPQR